MSVYLEVNPKTPLIAKEPESADQSLVAVANTCTICYDDVIKGQPQVGHDEIHPLHLDCAVPLYAKMSRPPCPSCRLPMDSLPEGSEVSAAESLQQHAQASLAEGARGNIPNALDPTPFDLENGTGFHAITQRISMGSLSSRMQDRAMTCALAGGVLTVMGMSLGCAFFIRDYL